MKTHQRGIALLEALLAVLLLAIGLLGTIGLQARAYSALSESGMRAEATIASEKLLGVISNDQDNAGDYALAANGVPGAALTDWYAETRKHIPGASITVTVGALVAGSSRRQVDIVISWVREKGKSPNRQATTAYISPAT
jgi:type IV pilus assembly protein PilV